MEAYKMTILSLLAGIGLALAPLVPMAHAQTVVVDEPVYYGGDIEAVVEDDDDVDDGAITISRNGMDRCAATFRSFNPATGTYTGYDGLKRMCPYLE